MYKLGGLVDLNTLLIAHVMYSAHVPASKIARLERQANNLCTPG